MIEVNGLTKYFGAMAAIEDVSFHVSKGEVIGFLGPNGAGKTTTMRILTGSLAASSGTARVAGFDINRDPIEVKKRVGYLPESVPLYTEMVVSKFLSYVAEVKGISRAERRSEVARVIERCGVGSVAKRTIEHLSKGFRQRVGLAQALIGSPPVLILDEPTVGLDPGQIVEIRDMIRGLAEDHTVLLSTHILPEVTMICERVIIVNRGRIAAQDSVARLTHLADGSAGEGTVVDLEAEGASERIVTTLKAVSEVLEVSETGAGHYRVAGASGVNLGPPVTRALVAAGIDVRALHAQACTLEDIFMEVVASDGGGDR